MKRNQFNHDQQFQDLPDEAFLRLRQLLDSPIIPFSVTTAMRRVSEGSFPAPIQLSTNIKAWRVRDIRRWLKDPENYQAVNKENCWSEK